MKPLCQVGEVHRFAQVPHRFEQFCGHKKVVAAVHNLYEDLLSGQKQIADEHMHVAVRTMA